MPNCPPATKLQVLQSIGRKQLKPYKSDTLNVFQASHSPPHAYICLTRGLDRAFVISEHGPTAEQYAIKLRSTLIDKVRLYNPLAGFMIGQGAEGHAYRASNYVAKAMLTDQAVAGGATSFLDLFEMFEALKLSSTGNTLAVQFDADEYPAIVWIESAPSRQTAMLRKTSEGANRPDDSKIRTLIFPSGIIITHGTDNPDALLEYYQRKLPFLLRFAKCAVL